ncbi:MAG: helix-turn-helix domain-containing protein [Defluviitaleaceae bacterium]|nr:helix-turn-helix domain-containing protein [Defluviitaleaceae bacterium]
MQDVGKNIARLRRERDMTQVELAEKLMVSYQAVSSWERGLTMPDVSKLPEISQILKVSIDELLGNSKQAEMVKHVLKQGSGVFSTQEPQLGHQLGQIAEIAPALKPSQLDDLVETARKNIRHIDIDGLYELAPYMEQHVIDQLAQQIAEVDGIDIDELCELAEYLSKEALVELAEKAKDAGDVENLCSIAPYLSKETLGQLALKVANIDDIENLCYLAPYISLEVLQQLALRALENDCDIDELASLTSYLSKKQMSELVIKAFGKQ